MKSTPIKQADAAPDALKYALPETKGQCLNAIYSVALRDPSMMFAAKRAALAVVKMTSIQPDLEATMRYVTPDGGMVDAEAGKAMLNALFSPGRGTVLAGLDGDVSDEDRVALSGDFEGWYENHYSALAPEWPQGHPVDRSVAGDDLYQMAAANNDHRLFSQDAWNPYYRTEEA